MSVQGPRRLEECPDVMTRAELRAVLQISSETLRRRVRMGLVPNPLPSGGWSKTVLRKWLETNGRTVR